ncbi:hypothetical protein BGZ50_009175, partial [Haplosporangium sp. Z 11]
MTFEQSNDAITKCRDLAREHGFTVKQETSSNKNVYLYCSREGVPDSVKNNKEIKRKRLSMRCDCKWRITLFQQESKMWVFRKAMNPASMVHNHMLISPDDIRQPWPAAVFDRIAFYANQRNLTTSETRERIKEDFPDLVWDERRFYNRLTEERKQIRMRDSESRVFTIMDLAARVASVASADTTLTHKVTTALESVLIEICEQLRIDPASAGSRVLTSPSSSAGGGGPGGSNTSMHMTSPTSTSPGPCPSTSSPCNASDYLVTYPGCVISVKNTPNQKGRPSSISSPVGDYGLGLGVSPLNDRKRSLSDECFTRHGIGGVPSSATPSFGSAMSATQMMSHLDMSATGPNVVAPIQGTLSSLDPAVLPGNPGLLMMQGNAYHTHTGANHTHQQHPSHSQQQQQHFQHQHQQLQYHHQQQQDHHGNHHMPSGMATAFRQTSLSQPPPQSHHHQQQSHQYHHHQPQQQQQQQHHGQPSAVSQEGMSPSDLSLSLPPSETSRPEPKRTHSVDIKQEIPSIYQPILSAPQLASAPQPSRRSGNSPGPGGSARLYSHPYHLSSHSTATSSSQQAPAPPISQHSGFHTNQLLGEPDGVFANQVAFPTGTDQYHYNSSSAGNNGYLHPGFSNANQQAHSPTMNTNTQPPMLGQQDR